MLKNVETSSSSGVCVARSPSREDSLAPRLEIQTWNLMRWRDFPRASLDAFGDASTSPGAFFKPDDQSCWLQTCKVRDLVSQPLLQ